MSGVLERLTGAWSALAHGLGRAQTVLILTLIYFLVVPVFSLVRLGDPLRRRAGGGDTWWEPMERVDSGLEEAERRF